MGTGCCNSVLRCVQPLRDNIVEPSLCWRGSEEAASHKKQ
jgi:hypothetical protein